MKPTHDDIIETKEVYIQLSNERYEGRLACVSKDMNSSANGVSLTAVAVMPVHHGFSLLNVFFQSNYREMNSSNSIVEFIKQVIKDKEQ